MNEAVDLNLIKEADTAYQGNFYLLKEFREMVGDYDRLQEQNNDMVHRYDDMFQRYQIEFNIRSSMEQSISFKTGRIMTYIPRKIRDFFKRNS